ncbi:MAG: ChuX/HutX family heme-like substrate-binding protein [Chthoniobacteraceae bacterium]
MQTTSNPLKARWAEYRRENPKSRIRDAAQALQVSEVELLATGCGETVTRLRPGQAQGLGDLLLRLPGLGRVMALTRNEHAVHERKGLYREIQFFQHFGNVLGPDIDLRFFLNSWASAFAVQEETPHGLRESLQFFAHDGSAIHKVYLEPEADRVAFAKLVEDFRHEDQSTEQAVQPPKPKTPDRADSEIDAAGLCEGWRTLQDTHDFFLLLRKFQVGRQQALRLGGPEFAQPVPLDSGERILRAAAGTGLPIMVFVGNDGMIQIHTGPVEKIAPYGEWINVLDSEFNLHLRQSAITSAWAVRKPTRDGDVNSLELYDASGEMVVQFFGRRKPGEAERPEWREVLQGLSSPEVMA